MKKVLASLIGTTFLFAASTANAQATRTWVSGVGDDANPCSRTAPCKTFAGAISKTATGGEINCLDPAGYGAVNITKSITIDCGQYTMGGILAANTNGVIVNSAGIVVQLRGLNINGANTTTGNGVRILNAAAVNIDDTVIENFGGTGTNGKGVVIDTSAANVRVNIQDSQFYNNNNIAIHSNPTGGNVILVIDNVTANRSAAATAVQLRQLTSATINRLTASNNPVGAGVSLELATATATISNSVLANNAIGVFAGNGGAPIVRLYGSVITGNTTDGLQIFGGAQIISSGNNIIRGNSGNEAPSSTPGQQ